MTTETAHADTHAPSNGHSHHHEPPPPTGIHGLTAPGWWRALWTTPLVGFMGVGLVCLIRWAAHWDPVWFAQPILTVSLATFPIGFLIGIGCFDYWAYYFSGRPTRPEDHFGARRAQVAGLLPPNTDHKVIGVQYLVTTMTFFVIGGFMAMLFRAEPRQAWRPVLQPPDLQRPDLRARGDHDLRRRRSGLRRPRQLRDPADDRLCRHGVPEAERPLVLDAPDGRSDHADRDGHPGRRPLRRLDVLRAALLAPAARPGLQHGRSVGQRQLDRDGFELPRHDHHDACAGHDVLADAAARLGQLHYPNIARIGFAIGNGKIAGVDPREMGVSDLVVIWGTNPVNTQVNVMTHASRAGKNAARRSRPSTSTTTTP